MNRLSGLQCVARSEKLAAPDAAASVPGMAVHTETFEVRTKGKGTYEITDAVCEMVERSKISSGTATVFVRHTSCSLVIMENAAPAARRDLEKFFERLVPEDAEYEHDDEGPDDSTSHIRMALTRTSEVIPIVEGKLQLGTWQGIFLFEHRRAPHHRKLVVSVIGE
jgi:secondary thiamine-phosphate synthase enzyme